MQEELLKKKILALKKLEFQKKVLDEETNSDNMNLPNALNHEPSQIPVPLAATPPPDPVAQVASCLKSVLEQVPEHTYKVVNEMSVMPDSMQKMLARQSVTIDLPYFSGEGGEYGNFYIPVTE